MKVQCIMQMNTKQSMCEKPLNMFFLVLCGEAASSQNAPLKFGKSQEGCLQTFMPVYTTHSALPYASMGVQTLTHIHIHTRARVRSH